MTAYSRKLREYPDVSFRWTKGKIDIVKEKQFHRYYELYLLLGGNAQFISDHARQPIVPFQLIIIPPNEYHRFVVAETDTALYERCVLTVDPEFLGDGVLDAALCGKERLTLSPDHRIAQHFLYLKETADAVSEREFRYILSAVVTDTVFLIKQSDPAAERETQGFLHPRSSEIMRYINENYKRDLSLREISQRFYLSVSAVSHIFKKDFGVSIKKYITEKRMNEIRLRLQRGERPTELFQEFGFSGYSTFYRSYKGYFGVPPSNARG